MRDPVLSASPAPEGIDEQVAHLLAAARLHLDMDVAFTSRFADGKQVIEAVSGNARGMDIAPGDSTAIGETYCARVLSGRLPPVIPDARRHPVARDLPATETLNIGSYVGAALRNGSGRAVGTVCCMSRAASPGLDESACRFMGLMAQLIEEHVAADRTDDATAGLATAEARVRRVLAERRIGVVLQPVVSIDFGRPVAYEAFPRFDGPTYPDPATVFAAARRAGLGTELELLVTREALAAGDTIPPDLRLSLNLSPRAILSPEVQGLLLAESGKKLAVEITEHTRVEGYPQLRAAVENLRTTGVRIVVDHAGAGYASLRHILRLRPDVIKLDADLVRGVESDPARRSMIRALLTFAGEVGAHLVAEGVDTPGQRHALHDLGVQYGQGRLYGSGLTAGG